MNSAGGRAGHGFPPPDTGLVIAAFMDVLANDEMVEPDTDFFDAGGNSVLAGRLVARVARTFGMKIKLKDVFTYRTPDELAGRLHELSRAPARPR
ncbi:acyl carrier protein [Nonomuraea monospora]